jgi:hypothetical protein
MEREGIRRLAYIGFRENCASVSVHVGQLKKRLRVPQTADSRGAKTGLRMYNHHSARAWKAADAVG